VRKKAVYNFFRYYTPVPFEDLDRFGNKIRVTKEQLVFFSPKGTQTENHVGWLGRDRFITYRNSKELVDGVIGIASGVLEKLRFTVIEVHLENNRVIFSDRTSINRLGFASTINGYRQIFLPLEFWSEGTLKNNGLTWIR
jgi:hypothetical protein